MTKEFALIWAMTALKMVGAIVAFFATVFLLVAIFGPWAPFAVYVICIIGGVSYMIARQTESFNRYKDK